MTMFARVALLPLDWDGWAIWQFKAKALALGTLREQLTDPAYGYSHPDYPLLLPRTPGGSVGEGSARRRRRSEACSSVSTC